MCRQASRRGSGSLARRTRKVSLKLCAPSGAAAQSAIQAKAADALPAAKPRKSSRTASSDGIHHGERLFLAPFPIAQPRDGSLIASVRDELETTNSFQRENLSSSHQFRGMTQCVVPQRKDCCRPHHTAPVEGRTANTRSAARESGGRAGRGIRTRTPGTSRTFHRSIRPVVRQCFNDAEARSAVRAVRKWIAITSIVRVENVAQAIRARRDVWENQRGLRTALLALANLEAFVADVSRNENSRLWITARGGFSLSKPEQKLPQHFGANLRLR